VYLIHSWVVVVLTWSYVKIYEACAGEEIYWSEGSSSSSTRMSGGALWLGWIYTLVLAQLISWPLAANLRKLPVLNEIL
jgi:hypothetical protein